MTISSKTSGVLATGSSSSRLHVAPVKCPGLHPRRAVDAIRFGARRALRGRAALTSGTDEQLALSSKSRGADHLPHATPLSVVLAVSFDHGPIKHDPSSRVA